MNDLINSFIESGVLLRAANGEFLVNEAFQESMLMKNEYIDSTKIDDLRKLLRSKMDFKNKKYSIRSSNVDEDAGDGVISEKDFIGGKLNYSFEKSQALVMELREKYFIEIGKRGTITREFSRTKYDDFENKLSDEFRLDARVIYQIMKSSMGSSFAGVGDTYLNVSWEDVLEKVIENFASCCTERALKYRYDKGESGKIALKHAVIIQEMVNSEKSAIVFSGDVSGEKDMVKRIVISAGFGLGSGLVDGTVQSDTIILDRYYMWEVAYIIGNKNRAVAMDKEKGGTTTIRIMSEDGDNLKTEAMRKSRIFSRDMSARIGAIVAKLENHYKTPVDTEWGIVGDTLYLLQVRPITALENYYREKEKYFKTLIDEHSNVITFDEFKKKRIEILRAKDKSLFNVSTQDIVSDYSELVSICLNKIKGDDRDMASFNVADFIANMNEIFGSDMSDIEQMKNIMKSKIVLTPYEKEELFDLMLSPLGNNVLYNISLLKGYTADVFISLYDVFYEEFNNRVLNETEKGIIKNEYSKLYDEIYIAQAQVAASAIGKGESEDSFLESVNSIRGNTDLSESERTKKYQELLNSSFSESRRDGRTMDGGRTDNYTKGIKPKIINAINDLTKRIEDYNKKNGYSSDAGPYALVMAQLLKLSDEANDNIIYIFDAKVEASENYLLGFSIIDNNNLVKLGLSGELVTSLKVGELAEYILHEVHGELDITHAELYGKPEKGKDREKSSIQGALFDSANPLRKSLRSFIEGKLRMKNFNSTIVPKVEMVKNLTDAGNERLAGDIASAKAINHRDLNVDVIIGHEVDMPTESLFLKVVRQFSSLIKLKFGNKDDNQQVRTFAFTEKDKGFSARNVISEIEKNKNRRDKGLTDMGELCIPMFLIKKGADNPKDGFIAWMRENINLLEGVDVDYIERILKDENFGITTDSYTDTRNASGGIQLPDIALRFDLATRHRADLIRSKDNEEARNSAMDKIQELLILSNPDMEEEYRNLDRSDVNKFLNAIVLKIRPIEYTELTQYADMMEKVAVSA